MVHELDDLVEEDAGGGDPHPVGDGEHGSHLVHRVPPHRKPSKLSEMDCLVGLRRYYKT